jgi:hypothetical protein
MVPRVTVTSVALRMATTQRPGLLAAPVRATRTDQPDRGGGQGHGGDGNERRCRRIGNLRGGDCGNKGTG